MTRAVTLACALATLGAPAVTAQSVRVTGSSSIRYIEVRTLERDSVASSETEGNALLRQLADGRIVRCIPGEAYCRHTRPGERVATVPFTQDVEVGAWGLGRGLRMHAQLRAHGARGARPDLWPQGSTLEVLGAFAELERSRLRVRAGRQWKTSGLGFYNFDGIALELSPVTTASVELYAGRSLLRGANEPRTAGALAAVDPFAPAAAGLLYGVHARYRPSARLALSATYQADRRRDGDGLYAALLATDAVLRTGAGSLEGAVEMDAAAGSLNEARLRLRTAPLGAIALQFEARRYRPYFELWTIWGAFSPVGFDEARVGATWAEQRGRLVVRTEAAYRSYATVADVVDEAMRDRGWSAGASALWLPQRGWRVDAGGRVEAGIGAARRDVHAGVMRERAGVGSLSVQALAFQRVYEFRLDEGTVLGLGAEGMLRLGDRTRLYVGAMRYRHIDASVGTGMDWNQRRASMRLHWTLGAEPGMTAQSR